VGHAAPLARGSSGQDGFAGHDLASTKDMNTQAMLTTHPKAKRINIDPLVTCIEACHDCVQACTTCADACLAEEMVAELRRCIRTNLDCAEICGATADVLSRLTEPEASVVRAQLEACALVCNACAEECERHAKKHEHCRVCAASCRRTEKICQQLLGQLRAAAK
jgi:hypothetical protein